MGTRNRKQVRRLLESQDLISVLRDPKVDQREGSHGGQGGMVELSRKGAQVAGAGWASLEGVGREWCAQSPGEPVPLSSGLCGQERAERLRRQGLMLSDVGF